MSMSVGYKPYMGTIDTSSARYKRAKAMYDEGHSNGESPKSAAEAKSEKALEELKMLKQMLGQKYDDPDLKFKNPLEADEETFIRNYMGLFDEDGDFVNPYGVAGMDATGKSLSEMHRIINVSDKYRQEMFDECKRHFIQENGVANGDTTKRTEVFTHYQLSVDKSDRLRGTWTLGQYEKNYTLAFAAAVKAANPGWKNGDPFDAKILDSVTRESVEASLVKSNSQYGEVLIIGNTSGSLKSESPFKNNSISRVENALREGLKNYPPKITQAKEKEVEISGDIRAEKMKRLEKQLKEGTFKSNGDFDMKA